MQTEENIWNTYNLFFIVFKEYNDQQFLIFKICYFFLFWVEDWT